MSDTIDAHQHFWHLSQPFDYRWLDAPALAPIRRDFLPEHLGPHLCAAGVRRSVFVQTQHNLAENRWALGLADQHPFIAGVVGWVDLTSPDCEEQLVALRRHPKFVGVRHVTQDEPDDDFILRPDVRRGLGVLEKHGVPFDLLFYVRHLRHAATVAREFPELPLVLDHLAKPLVKEGRTDDWLPHLKAAAGCPNVYCKLSGLVTEADWQRWTAADLRPFVRAALDLFGPGRCMYGSDWPVCEVAATYQQVHAALVEAIGPLGDAERAAIFGGTARAFYDLPDMPL
jgi:L-fuconolactonase